MRRSGSDGDERGGRAAAQRVARQALGGLLLGLGLALLAACDGGVRIERGPSYEPPSGMMEGTVLYVGQRPRCRYESGRPTQVLGAAVLLLFEYDNPPPPDGGASTAVSFLAVPGRELFSLDDCLPESPSEADLQQVITRSAAFRWPSIPLAQGAGAEVAYQVRALYDRDGDFNPFFSITRGATRGDVAGGAFEVVGAEHPTFRRIVFGSAEDHPLGQRVPGITVALGARVNTEPPVFRLHEQTVAMASDARVPTTSDIVAAEQQLWELTKMRLVSVDPTDGPMAGALGAAGLSLQFPPVTRGFHVEPVDVDGDGTADLHPVLGAKGIPWYFPLVLMQRARTIPEQLGGIPPVVFVGTVRLTQVLGGKKVFHPELDVAVPPVAVAYLDPKDPACRVPIIAPGNPAQTYERIPVDCQELPTGNYDVVVLQGRAGGAEVDLVARYLEEHGDWTRDQAKMAAAGVSDTGWLIEGGSFAGQSWTVPNELGCPDPMYDPNPVSEVDDDPSASCRIDVSAGTCSSAGTHMICDQGPSGRFAVVDPDPSDAPDPGATGDGHGLAGCQQAVDEMSGSMRAVHYMPVPDRCCESVRHLCGLPLCDARPLAYRASADGGRLVRQVVQEGVDYEVDAEGKVHLKCVPFLPPASCCR